MSGGDGGGDDVRLVGEPLLSVVADDGKPTPDNSISSNPIMSSYIYSFSSKSGSCDDSI